MTNKNKLWIIIINIALLSASTLCIIIYIYFPGAISQAQEASLYNISTLPRKLASIPLASYLLNVLIAFAGMVFYGASCISLGMRIANIFFQIEKEKNDTIYLTPWILLPTYFLIGNTMFSLFFLTLASLASLSAVHSIVILCLGIISGITQFRKLPLPTIHIHNRFEKNIFLLCIAILIVSIFQSSAHLSYDASAIYFSIAKLTALKHHTGYYLDYSFPVSTLHSITQFITVIQIFGDQSARMTSWLFGVINVFLAIALARRVGLSDMSQYILSSLILTSTAFLDQMGDGKVDLVSSAYSLAAVYWLITDTKRPHQSRSLYFLAGSLIGFACITRPYNVFLFGVFVCVYTMQQIISRRDTFSQGSKNIGWIALGAAGLAAYHLLMNKIILGSPFGFLISTMRINPTNGPWDFKPETIWLYRLLYPFVVTFKNSGASLGNITPLALIILSTLIIKELRQQLTIHQDTFQLAISSGITLFSWIMLFFTIIEVRYVLFLWILLFILIAEIATNALKAGSFIIRNALKIWIVVFMSFILVRSLYISISTYSPLDKYGNPQCFDSKICGSFTAIDKVAEPGDRVLTLSAYRYYLRTDLFTCSTDNNEYKILQNLSAQNADDFWAEVYRQGYKYIAFEDGYTKEHVQLKFIPSPSNTPQWLKLERIFGESGDLKTAYKINVSNPPINVEYTCKVNRDLGIWEVQRIIP